MNRVHSLLDKYDVKCDYDNIFGVKGTRWLRSLKLSDNDQILLHEYVMQIEFLKTEIKDTESKISYQASKNESVKILMSMTGIDHFSAMLIASEIGDITRFSTPENLVYRSGLCPSIHQSGNSLYMGRLPTWTLELTFKDCRYNFDVSENIERLSSILININSSSQFTSVLSV